MPIRSDFELAIACVAAHGLAASSFETIKTIAIGVWQTEEYPPPQLFIGDYSREAVLLVERLSFYPTVHAARKQLLLSLVSELTDPQISERRQFCQLFSLFLVRLKPLSGKPASTRATRPKAMSRPAGLPPCAPRAVSLIWAKPRDILRVE